MINFVKAEKPCTKKSYVKRQDNTIKYRGFCIHTGVGDLLFNENPAQERNVGKVKTWEERVL